MKEYGKLKSHISSKIHVIYMSFNYVRHSVAKTFTTLHPTTLHYTCRHFTSSHLNFTQLHFTTLSFGLIPSKFPTAPFHLTSLHFTSLHFTALSDVRCEVKGEALYGDHVYPSKCDLLPVTKLSVRFS